MKNPNFGTAPRSAELKVMHDVLTEMRATTLHRITSLSRQFNAIVEACAWTANDDEHDPEGATIAYERAQVASLLTQAREELSAIDRAAEQLRNGTYGLCRQCKHPIGHERLAALPTVQTCIRCATRTRP